jgi:hypothetical protein
MTTAWSPDNQAPITIFVLPIQKLAKTLMEGSNNSL